MAVQYYFFQAYFEKYCGVIEAGIQYAGRLE